MATKENTMTKTILRIGLLGAGLIGPMAGIASAQAEPNRPVTAAPVDARDNRPIRDDRFNWGLLGLFGLAGLAGLTRRNETKEYRSNVQTGTHRA